MRKQEGQDSRVDLPDDSPHILARVLEYLYTGSYDVNDALDGLGLPEEKIWEESKQENKLPDGTAYWSPRKPYGTQFKIHALVYQFADRYSIESLKRYSAEAFEAMNLDNIPLTELPGLLEWVCETSASKDHLIKKYIYIFCIRKFTGTKKITDTLRFMEKQEPLAMHVGTVIREKLSNVQDELNRQVAQNNFLKSRICGLELEVKAREDLPRQEIVYLKKVIADMTTHCRFCGTRYMRWTPICRATGTIDPGLYERRCMKCFQYAVIEKD